MCDESSVYRESQQSVRLSVCLSDSPACGCEGILIDLVRWFAKNRFSANFQFIFMQKANIVAVWGSVFRPQKPQNLQAAKSYDWDDWREEG